MKLDHIVPSMFSSQHTILLRYCSLGRYTHVHWVLFSLLYTASYVGSRVVGCTCWVVYTCWCGQEQECKRTLSIRMSLHIRFRSDIVQFAAKLTLQTLYIFLSHQPSTRPCMRMLKKCACSLSDSTTSPCSRVKLISSSCQK